MPDQNENGQVLSVSTVESKTKPWRNGFFQMGDLCLGLAKVSETRQTFLQLKFLDCEEDAEQDMSLVVVEEEGGGVLVTLMGETVEARVSL